MATPVTVPSLGEEIASAVLIRFLVEPGAEVSRGDPLYELDTDKVTQEVEAEADGVLLAVTGTPGVDYLVGARSAGSAPRGRSRPPSVIRAVAIDHLVLTVRDVDETCGFYSRVLGMEAVTFAGGRRALRFGHRS